jgi:hypothetical protein
MSTPEQPEDRDRELLSQLAGNPKSLQVLTRIAEALGDEKAAKTLQQRSPSYSGRLRNIYQTFHRKTEFHIGDIVRWKADLKNKNHPAYDTPAVVFDIVDPPYVNSASPGSPYFSEPLNLVIGYFADDEPESEGLLLHHVDSRRFEHHPEFLETSTSDPDEGAVAE